MKDTGRKYLAGIMALAAVCSCVTNTGTPTAVANAETIEAETTNDCEYGTGEWYEEISTTVTTEADDPEDEIPLSWYDAWEDYCETDNVRYASASGAGDAKPRLVVRECTGTEQTVVIPEWVMNKSYAYSRVIGVEYDGTAVRAGEGIRQRHLVLPESVSWASFYDFSADGTPDDPANYYDLFTTLTFRNPNCDIRIPNIAQIKALLAQNGLTLTIRGYAGSTAETFAQENGLPFEVTQAEADGLTYEFLDGCATVTGWDGESSDVTVPAEIDGKRVTAIGVRAFSCSEQDRVLNSISLPDSIRSIGYEAFSGCALESFTFPAQLEEIGENAFYECGLTAAVLPEGMKTIGKEAFYGCGDLESVTLPETVEVIEEGAFMHCWSLKSVRLPDSVKRIESWAFYGCNNLAEAEIPDGCTFIGREAFSQCDLKSVVLPDSVTELAESAFYACGDAVSELKLSAGLTEIPESAFCDICVLDSVVIPEGVKKIGLEAFGMVNNLTVLAPDCELDEEFMTSGSSPTIYGYRGSTAQAFAEAHQMIFTALEDGETIRPDFEKNLIFREENGKAYVKGLSDETPHLVIPAEYEGCPVVGIDAQAFSGHSELLSVEIPDTVTEIGRAAFWNCSLDSVKLPAGLTEIEDEVFCDCALQSVELPEHLTRIGDNAFSYNRLTDIKLPEGLKEIGYSAFACNYLRTISIPDSVEKLGDSIFSGCRWLSFAKLPKGITRIGSYMFSNCEALTEFVIPETVTEIGDNAFAYTALESVTLPESLKTIEWQAFDSCTHLTQITIPKNVTKIGYSAFYDCFSLRDAELPDGLQEIGSMAFFNTALTDVTLPASLQEAGYLSFYAIRNPVKLTVLNPECEMQECFGQNLEACDPESCLFGLKDSTAHAYANWLGVRFFDLDGNEITKASAHAYDPTHDDTEWDYTGVSGTAEWWDSETTTECWNSSEPIAYETTGEEYPAETTDAYAYTTTTLTTMTTPIAVISDGGREHIASDEALCGWAVKDYQAKTGAEGICAEITAVNDGTYEITLTDESGKVAEVYTVDPTTGTGTDSANEPVNLPQTGNNSIDGWLAVGAALLLTGFGWYFAASAGVTRRKEEENE